MARAIGAPGARERPSGRRRFQTETTEVFPTEDEERFLGHLGPDVLGPDWDEGEVLKRLEARVGERIGDVLIDQTVMAGPGNVYRARSVALSGVHPFELVQDVTEPPRWSS